MLFSGEHYRKDRGAGDAREWVEVVHRVLRVGPTERRVEAFVEHFENVNF